MCMRNLSAGPTHLNPRIAAVGADDVVGHHLHLLLRLCIVERAPDEALGGIDRVGGVGDGLQAARAGRERESPSPPEHDGPLPGTRTVLKADSASP